jgi:hypothetical protein
MQRIEGAGRVLGVLASAFAPKPSPRGSIVCPRMIGN